MNGTVAPDLGLEFLRQRVHHGHADSVQTSGHLVGIPVEFPAGMKNRQHHLGGGFPLPFHDVHGNPASVVVYGDRVVGVDCHGDVVAMPRHRLVDGVVHDFVDKVVKAVYVRAPDVHRRALPDRLQAFQNLNVIDGIVVRTVPVSDDIGQPFCHRRKILKRLIDILYYGTVLVRKISLLAGVPCTLAVRWGFLA